jgi:Replication-relaxation
MKAHALETLKVLNRRRYGRRNFLTALLGGSEQRRRKELGILARDGYLIRHSPTGAGKIERAYPFFFHRIYENGPKADVALRHCGIEPSSKDAAHQFWHQVFIDDILLSIEIGCKHNALDYQDLPGLPDLPCKISHTINGKVHTSDKSLRPDAVFRIGSKFFCLEADRGTEPIERANLSQTSYLRKLLQYRQVFSNQAYKTEWKLDNLLVLNVTVGAERAKNIMASMRDDIKAKASFLLFQSAPSLASSYKAPGPALNLITEACLSPGGDPLPMRRHNAALFTDGYL